MQYVKRERDLMSILEHPFFVKLYFTFQDDEKLCILASPFPWIRSYNEPLIPVSSGRVFSPR